MPGMMREIRERVSLIQMNLKVIFIAFEVLLLIKSLVILFSDITK